MNYIIQTTAYTGVFYLAYVLLLRNREVHSWNRFYLLLSALLAPVLPFLVLPTVPDLPMLAGTVFNLPDITILASKKMPVGTSGISFVQICIVLYALVGALMLGRLVMEYRAYRQFLKGKFYVTIPGNIKVITNCGTGPGSFNRYIFFPGLEQDPDILNHEKVHVLQRHSLDIVVMKVLRCLFWPNLFLPLITNELRAIHEFQADRYGSETAGVAPYTSTLLNSVFGTTQFSLMHTFFHHPIKRRITMLQNKPKSRTKLRAIAIRSGLATAFLVAGLTYLQSCNRQPTPISKDVAVTNATGEIPFAKKTASGDIARMPKAEYELTTFLSEHIKYPDEARSKGIEGKVIVRFVVNENGEVTNPEIARSPDTTLSTEALRVTRLLPKWTPGLDKNGEAVRAVMAIPIRFKLD
ncbi:MAG: TonB family protein [Taibaiella sp.]|nr:TonB family protein [Taibaiella sp.]